MIFAVSSSISAVSVSARLVLTCFVCCIAAASMWLPGTTIIVVSTQVICVELPGAVNVCKTLRPSL